MSVVGKWIAEGMTGDMDKMFAASEMPKDLIPKVKEKWAKDKAELTISKSGDSWTIDLKKVLAEYTKTLKSGESFEMTAHGKTYKIEFNLLSDEKIIETHTSISQPSKPPVVLTRYIKDGKLITDMQAKDQQITLTMVRM